MRNKFLVAIAAVAALVAGCDSDSGSSAEPGTTAVAPTSDAAPPADAQPKRGEHSPGAALTVTDIRIGTHSGFDRVVYEFGGTGTPGWQVGYTDRAVQDGSGAVLDIAGQSLLEVRITGSAYPFDSGVTPYEGPDPATDASAPLIAGVYRTLVFEGTTQSFIGVNDERPAFEVTTLTNPTRLVIDIAAPH
ncbi:hypothetical protein IU487_06710 [Nocardia puris]|uniref:AMIN-like domain-containing (lipo)protein n=1 Tax=Nocardia puris TaxID=208602 RepID=UPI001893B107|nr:hypothetical protein [Nocardia puris]MBF6210739.1 hypothetical protein [Nocardia puris]